LGQEIDSSSIAISVKAAGSCAQECPYGAIAERFIELADTRQSIADACHLIDRIACTIDLCQRSQRRQLS
jgi:hypothetical protein